MSRVLALEWWTQDVFELILERPSWTYRAGECTLLIHTDQIAARPYSFSSHPDQDHLRFLIRAVDSPGGFSRWLSTRKMGDEVGVGTPFGLFEPGKSAHEVWLATGTGLAPFLSCLRADSPRVSPILYWGLRTKDEAHVADFLSKTTSFHLLISRGGDPKRITTSLEGFPWGEDREYFLCGNGAMISQCRRELVAGNVAEDRIHEEKFFA